MSDLITVTSPAVPNLPLGTVEYERQYQDQFTNVLRLYFNQLNIGLNGVISNQNTMQTQINHDLTLVWISGGGGIFSG